MSFDPKKNMFTKATREQINLRLALCGPTGSGKTYTGLGVAATIAKKLGLRPAVIDTESKSSDRYADRFDFDRCILEEFSPEAYEEAIDNAAAAGYGVLLIDSFSHAWDGPEGLLERVDQIAAQSKSGNSFQAWGKATPLFRSLIRKILNFPGHVILTMRVKMEYVIEENEKGRKVPMKVGMAPVMRAGVEYEFDICGDMDLDHRLTITKSRCFSLANKVITKPGIAFAEAVYNWAAVGEQPAAKIAENDEAGTPPPTTKIEYKTPTMEKIVPPPVQKEAVKETPPPADKPATEEPKTERGKNIKKFAALAAEKLGIDPTKNPAGIANLASTILGREIDSSRNLTAQDAEICATFMENEENVKGVKNAAPENKKEEPEPKKETAAVYNRKELMNTFAALAKEKLGVQPAEFAALAGKILGGIKIASSKEMTDEQFDYCVNVLANDEQVAKLKKADGPVDNGADELANYIGQAPFVTDNDIRKYIADLTKTTPEQVDVTKMTPEQVGTIIANIERCIANYRKDAEAKKPATKADLDEIKRLAGMMGKTSRADLLAIASGVVKREIKVSTDLTTTEAQTIITELTATLNKNAEPADDELAF